MSIVQISAAFGSAECEHAVQLTLQEILKDAKQQKSPLEIIEDHPTKYGFSSVLLTLDDNKLTQTSSWLNTWLGTIQWTFQSKIRPHHKRKNWFVGVTLFQTPQQLPDDNTIIFQACRASGAGGQHVLRRDRDAGAALPARSADGVCGLEPFWGVQRGTVVHRDPAQLVGRGHPDRPSGTCQA